MNTISEQELAILESISQRAYSVTNVEGVPVRAVTDCLAVLCGYMLRHDPTRSEWGGNDKLVFGYEPALPAYNAVRAELERMFPDNVTSDDVTSSSEKPLRPTQTSFFECATYQALSYATGLVFGGRKDTSPFWTYCVTDDSALRSGMYWEAVLFATAQKMNTLTHVLLRVNEGTGVKRGGGESVVRLVEKYEACGWMVTEVDVHTLDMCVEALVRIRNTATQPSVLIAHSVEDEGGEVL